jgi:hypothetical protein
LNIGTRWLEAQRLVRGLRRGGKVSVPRVLVMATNPLADVLFLF